jgi:hypothetical protein
MFTVSADEEAIRHFLITELPKNDYKLLSSDTQLSFQHGSLLGAYLSGDYRQWLAHVTIRFKASTQNAVDVKVTLQVHGWAYLWAKKFWIEEMDLIETIARGRQLEPIPPSHALAREGSDAILLLAAFSIAAIALNLWAFGLSLAELPGGLWNAMYIVSLVVLGSWLTAILVFRIRQRLLQRGSSRH